MERIDKVLRLHPRWADEVLMLKMASEGLIRLLNGKLGIVGERNQVNLEYATDGRYGGHKLIHVTICEHTLTRLTSHPEPEEFILIGPDNAVPMVLIIARHPHETIVRKHLVGKLSEEDFYCIFAPFNQVKLSIFTMLPGILHAELLHAPLVAGDVAPTFYVTESSDLIENHVMIENMSILECDALALTVDI